MERPATVAVACLFSLVFLFLPGAPAKRVFWHLSCVFPFVALSFVTLLFSDGWPITREAVAFSLLLAGRIVACVLVVHLVAFDAVRDHLDCLHALKIPDALTSTLYLTSRYLHLVGRQLLVTRNALASRLFSPDGRIKTFRIYGQLLGGMTVRAIDRSEQVRKAMESRGFHGKIPGHPPLPIRKSDVLKSTAALLPLAILLLAERLLG